MPNVVAVVGASRGIGLALTKQLLRVGYRGRPIDTLFALARHPEAGEELTSLSHLHGSRIIPTSLDISDADSIRAASSSMRTECLARHGVEELNLLLHVAGILSSKEHSVTPERRLKDFNAEAIDYAFRVNTFGPMLMMKEVSPLLVAAAKRNKQESHERGSDMPGSTAAFFSARVGSIEDNASGGWYSYRCSKAALNQFVKSCSYEMGSRGVCCVSIHPGTVDTDLTRQFLKARAKYNVQDLDAAASNLHDIIDSLKLKQDGGTFLDWQRAIIPW